MLSAPTRGKQHRIKGTPGKENLPVHLKAMACWHQGHPPSNNIALVIKFRIWQACEALFQLVLADPQRGRKGSFRERLPSAHMMENRVAEVFLLTL